jgi:uncharacterized protein (DUF362 family)
MKRRDFIRKSVGAGILAGSSISLSSFGRMDIPSRDAAYDLVAVKGGMPEVMLDKALESLGGIGRFVKKGQSVVIKPNIGWDVVPEKAANTNPKLVGKLVKLCLNAGAKEVFVFDNPCDEWQKCYKNSGIENEVKLNGGKMVPGHTESYYQAVNIPKGKVLKNAKEHELLLESNVFINVPVLKSHDSTKLTISMKNLMGAVWDRGYWHQNNLSQCIADYVTYRKPDLNIVDGYNVMKRNGPRGVSIQDVVNLQVLIASTDIVAADAAATKFFGLEPANITHIRYAADMGVGTMDLTKLNINRITL